MRLQGQAGGLVVGDDVLALRHDGQRDMVDRNRLVGKQRQVGHVGQATHLPQRGSSIEFQTTQRIRFRQCDECRPRKTRANQIGKAPCVVILAQARIQRGMTWSRAEVPAFAGMTTRADPPTPAKSR